MPIDHVGDPLEAAHPKIKRSLEGLGKPHKLDEVINVLRAAIEKRLADPTRVRLDLGSVLDLPAGSGEESLSSTYLTRIMGAAGIIDTRTPAEKRAAGWGQVPQMPHVVA